MSYTIRVACAHCGRSYTYSNNATTKQRACPSCDTKPAKTIPVPQPRA